MSSTRDLKTVKKPLSPPSLEELAEVLAPALATTYIHSDIRVVPCPDLREPPYHLAAAGLCGDERVADVGGQAHLMPQPQRDKTYSLLDLAQRMELPATGGHILGASAGPFHVIGQNCELAPNLAWTQDPFASVVNRTYVTQFTPSPPTTTCTLSPSLDAALLANLYGSAGRPGPVLRIRARERRRPQDGSSSSRSADHNASFSDTLRRALATHYGEDRQVSLGGVFAIRRGTAHYHVMPDFPTEPWGSRKEFDAWLTWHDFAAPMTCLSVLHSADPAPGLGLRVEHTHAFSGVGDAEGSQGGGHYHYDVLPGEREGKAGEEEEEIEYEGYFNVAKWVYRIDRPET